MKRDDLQVSRDERTGRYLTAYEHLKRNVVSDMLKQKFR